MEPNEPNLVVYYRLDEYGIYTPQSIQESMTGTLIDITGYSSAYVDSYLDFFTVDCPPGMAGTLESGCLAY